MVSQLYEMLTKKGNPKRLGIKVPWFKWPLVVEILQLRLNLCLLPVCYWILPGAVLSPSELSGCRKEASGQVHFTRQTTIT